MARLELIKELEIRKQEIYSVLKEQFPELYDELHTIDILLSKTKKTGLSAKADAKATVTTTLSVKSTNGTPKGDMIWIEYVHFMLREIGGKGKSRDVANAIVKANSNVSLKRAVSASQDKLSKLNKSGKIKATSGASLKNGNMYEII